MQVNPKEIVNCELCHPCSRADISMIFHLGALLLLAFLGGILIWLVIILFNDGKIAGLCLKYSKEKKVDSEYMRYFSLSILFNIIGATYICLIILYVIAHLFHFT